MIKIRSGGAWRDFAGVPAWRSGGAWHQAQNIYRRSGGGWVNVWVNYTPVSGYASPTSIAGGAQGAPASGNVTSNFTAAYGQNGNGNYTYTWSIASVSNGVAPTISSPNGQATAISRVVTAAIGAVTGLLACTISDGRSSFVVYVNYTLSYSTLK